ncbi:Uncharacterised protein [uncultured archaeon]|nr:Uncharacterised protein [uncultured archaeon]
MVIRRTLIRKTAGKTPITSKAIITRRASQKAALSPEVGAEIRRLKKAKPHDLRMEFMALARRFGMKPGMNKALAEEIFILNAQARTDTSIKMTSEQRTKLINAMLKMKQAMGA